MFKKLFLFLSCWYFAGCISWSTLLNVCNLMFSWNKITLALCAACGVFASFVQIFAVDSCWKLKCWSFLSENAWPHQSYRLTYPVMTGRAVSITVPGHGPASMWGWLALQCCCVAIIPLWKPPVLFAGTALILHRVDAAISALTVLIEIRKKLLLLFSRISRMPLVKRPLRLKVTKKWRFNLGQCLSVPLCSLLQLN